ncbi:hypothetical protein BFI45_18640 [Yersinia pestis subsp. microtus bv. Altaica]|nr:hypothetical protein BFI45_18640 [Yersinia pestis subsp. microtus bv. Altaica]OVY73144.1 hypothetical protein BFI50_18310 [Yersinia pestis subsp. microtus bv. Xilingolensis]OVY84973.1 hypothetical protein BFI52_11010 [Yersinia pestis subsp. microtus]PSH14158.1 hypothetical protein B7R75_12155 [Yersinia pseudotuberculosis]OVY54346.1 hypothetical protein BFI46_18370 [Yersinia pestis subsp. microtus bv. Altaica]
MCGGCFCSPQSLTCVSSWGCTQLPPSCNSNYLEYSDCRFNAESEKMVILNALLIRPGVKHVLS